MQRDYDNEKKTRSNPSDGIYIVGINVKAECGLLESTKNRDIRD